MKKLLLLALIMLTLSCSNDTIETNETNENLDNQTFEKGKPAPKKRNIVLTPTAVNNNTIGRIMQTPVEYTGDLPITDNGGLVDWDNDGTIDDQIVINTRCYFPKTFTEISVFLNGTDEHIINYSSRFGTTVLGFVDADNDGDMDVIFEGGNPYCYNDGGVFSQYNVGYNVEGQYPLSTKDILTNMVVTSVAKNPNNLIWDLSAYGYECYTFHVYFFNKDLKDYRQTTTYGEWGFFFNKKLTSGDTYVLRFTNVEDNCENLEVEFVYN